MRIPDYHLHPNYSIDARGSVAEYTHRSAERGLEEICFTTHVDLDPERSSFEWVNDRGRRCETADIRWAEHYWEDIERAQRECDGTLRLKKGLEVDWFPGVEDLVRPLLEAFPWDFVLLSVHCLDHLTVASNDEGGRYLARHSAEQTAVEYVHQVRDAILSGLGQAIAHLDYYKRQKKSGFRKEFLEALEPRLEDVLKLLANQDMALEINSRAIRTYGLGVPFPGPSLLAMAQKQGVRQITLGSDSHRPDEVGNCFEESLLFAREAGFDKVTTYSGGKIEREIALQATP